MTARQRPARLCSWYDCPLPATATVAFALPNLLAGSRRDYCADHTTQVCLARGTVLVARSGAQQSVLPGLGGSAAAGRPTREGGAAGRG